MCYEGNLNTNPYFSLKAVSIDDAEMIIEDLRKM